MSEVLREMFHGKSRLFVAGNMEKFTIAGRTNLKPGGIFPFPVMVDGAQLDVLFNIRSVEVKKVSDMRDADYEQGILPGKTHIMAHSADLTSDQPEVIVLEVDTDHYEFSHVYQPQIKYRL